MRRNGDGTLATVSIFDGSLVAARARMVTFARDDRTSTWESVGGEGFRFVDSFRQAL